MTKIAEGRSFVFFVMFVNLVFRQSNIVLIGLLSLLVMKTNSLTIL